MATGRQVTLVAGGGHGPRKGGSVRAFNDSLLDSEPVHQSDFSLQQELHEHAWRLNRHLAVPARVSQGQEAPEGPWVPVRPPSLSAVVVILLSQEGRGACPKS